VAGLLWEHFHCHDKSVSNVDKNNRNIWKEDVDKNLHVSDLIFCSITIYYLLYKYKSYQIMYLTLANNIHIQLFCGLLLCLILNTIDLYIY
jgi:hypothetical protein